MPSRDLTLPPFPVVLRLFVARASNHQLATMSLHEGCSTGSCLSFVAAEVDCGAAGVSKPRLQYPILLFVSCTRLQVASQQELPAGSESEIEIRAASVVAVEMLKNAANEKLQPKQSQQGNQEAQLLSIQLDWWLWHEGERLRQEHPPHHRTRTIYY